MEMKDIKNKNDKDLEKELGDKRKALRLFRFSLSGSKIKNVKEGIHLRKDIARILTEISVRAKSQK